MKYLAKIDLSNKNNSHTLAYDLVQDLAAGRTLDVLEVGCSAGYFGGALKECGHCVWGVEPDEEAALAAREVLDKVYNGFIQDFFKSYSELKFDVIVFGDVLEHLIDPEDVLSQCRMHLKHGGGVVASVPNVAHISVRAMILEGRWDYSELGILDRTHLKFFTRQTLVQMFSSAAYQVDEIHPVRLSAEQADDMCNLNLKPDLISAAKSLAKDECLYDFQYVLLAKPVVDDVFALEQNSKALKNKGVRVICLLQDTTSALAELRLRLPLERWAIQNNGTFRTVSIFEFVPEDLEWGDVYVFQRDFSKYTYELIRNLKTHNKKIIFEIDDLLTEVPPFSSHQNITAANRNYLIKSMKLSDAVTVTTDRLKAEVSIFNTNSRSTPNCSEPLLNCRAKHYEVPTDQVTLIVAATDKVLVEFIIPALKKAQKMHAVKIIGIGPPGETLSSAGLDVELVQVMPYGSFKKFIASIDNGVGLIPLDASRFSASKSPIKFFDYALAGIPSICSDVPPYLDYIIDGEYGFLVDNTTESWYLAIESLVGNYKLRKQIVQASAAYVNDNFNWNVAARAWQEVIVSLNIQTTDKKETSISHIKYRPAVNKDSFAWLVRQLFSPVAYRKVIKIYRKHGIRGLLVRVRRR